MSGCAGFKAAVAFARGVAATLSFPIQPDTSACHLYEARCSRHSLGSMTDFPRLRLPRETKSYDPLAIPPADTVP